MTPVISFSRTISTSFLTLLFLICSHQASACRCVTLKLVEKVQTSDIIAKVKLLKITPDPVNSEYHDAVIEVIDLYKGTSRNSIKIRSILKTSCAFLPNENTTWIIFAKQWKDQYSFDACSGSLQDNGGSRFTLNQEVLGFFRKHQITGPQPQGTFVHIEGMEKLKGFRNKNRFAAFQINIKANGSIDKIRQLQGFENGALNRQTINAIKKTLFINGPDGEPLETSITICLVVYYYPQQGRHKSFVSLQDL